MKKGARRLAAKGISAEYVARDIEHALTAHRPRTRYATGADAKIRAIMRRLLPDRWIDYLTMKELTG